MLLFQNSSAEKSLTASINDLNLVSSSKHKNLIGLQRGSATGTKPVNMTFNNVEINHKESKVAGNAAIVNNGSNIFVNNNFKIITGVNSYDAIDLTHFNGNSTISFASATNVIFEDNRLALAKKTEALIGYDGTCANVSANVTNPEKANLAFVPKSLSKRSKDGWDICSSITKATDITNGTIELDKATGTNIDVVNIKVLPNAGYELDTIKVYKKASKTDLLNTSISSKTDYDYKFNMIDEAVEVNATFKLKEYLISTSVNSNEGAINTSHNKATMGSAVTITVNPKYGYELSSITSIELVSNTNIEVTDIGNNQYTFTMPAANVLINVAFSKVAVADENTPVIAPASKPVPTIYIGEDKPEIKVLVSDNTYVTENDSFSAIAPIIIEENRTFLGIRDMACALGIAPEAIKWNEKTKTASITKSGATIEVTQGSKDIKLTYKGYIYTVQNDVSAINRNDRIYLPFRVIFEFFGYEVNWDNETRTITCK